MNRLFLSKEKGNLSFLKGAATAYISNPCEYKEVPDQLGASEGLYLEGDFVAEIQFDDYRLVYPSVNAQSDLFYMIRDNKLIFGFDFIQMAREHRDILSLDSKAIDYFLRNSLFRPGETFYKEIKRILIGDGLVINKDGSFYIVSFPVKEWDVDPDVFYNGIKSFCVHQNPVDDMEYLLFSSGRDSALLSLILKNEIGINMHYLTSVPKQFYDGGDYNVKFEVYKDVLGEFEKVSLDYDKYTWADIKYMVRKMPLAAHMSLAYDVMNRYIDKRGGRSWTGQDADSMYCLGYSGDGYLDMMERYFISDGFLKSLEDVQGDSFVGGVLGKIIAWLGSKKTGKRLCSPLNLEELKDCIINTYSTVPILDINHRINSILNHKVTLTEARSILWNNKMSLYVTARDHRTVAYAGCCRKPTVFPYSSAMMYFILINMRRDFSEIITNKRLISKRIEYYIGKKKFKKLYPKDFFMKNRVSMDYEKNILMNCTFGESLRKTSDYSGGVLSHALAKCWMDEVFRLIQSD